MTAPVTFDLPGRLIAQEPSARRDGSRLLVLDRSSGAIQHRRFSHLPRLLGRGDLIVANHSAVLPARLLGRRPTGGAVECLLIERSAANGAGPGVESWTCLARPGRRLRAGERLEFGRGLSGRLVERNGEIWRIDLQANRSPARLLDRVGHTPLPPYIRRAPADRRERRDRRRYRTVYQEEAGSVAAPTAGLHFSDAVRRRLRAKGVGWAPLTLHLGPASFLPVRPEDPERASVPAERFSLSAATAARIEWTRKRGGRVIAVGTSTTRVLEARAGRGGLRPGRGTCDLFIRPGHRFRQVDALLTNFHLPGSTHLLLVAAFAGRESILNAYRNAIDAGYRFYSYGDAMLIL